MAKRNASDFIRPFLQVSDSKPSESKRVDNAARTVIILAVGIIIGVSFASVGLKTLARQLDTLIIGFVVLVSVIGVITVWVVLNKEMIIKKLFGITDVDLTEIKKTGRDLFENLTDKDYDEAERNFNILLSKASAWYVWFNFRRWILVVFQALFLGFGGLLGTILLFNQNLLIGQQTERLDKQNELIETQNERIDQQTYLQEADRRSALVFRMDNTWNEVDRELKSDVNRPNIRDLSPELISRIITLSEMLRPYRYLQGGTLSSGELSPERGQMLISLVNSSLDTNTLTAIFEKGNFQFADLLRVNLRRTYLKGANLNQASLRETIFSESTLSRANLNKTDAQMADFYLANCRQTQFAEANLQATDFRQANLSWAVFAQADLRKADLSRANLYHANLRGTDLTGANLTGANLEGAIVMKSWFAHLSNVSPDSIVGRQYLLDSYTLDSVIIDTQKRYVLRKL